MSLKKTVTKKGREMWFRWYPRMGWMRVTNLEALGWIATGEATEVIE